MSASDPNEDEKVPPVELRKLADEYYSGRQNKTLEGDALSPGQVSSTAGNDGPPNGPVFTRAGVQRFLSSKAGTQVLLLIGLFVVIVAVNWYAGSIADEKTADWFTSYNGVATTKAVGRITSDLDTKSTPRPTPSSTPSPSPSLSPSPSPDDKSSQLAATAATAKVGSVGSGAGNAAATPTPFPTPNAEETQRLEDQLATIRDRTRHHGAVMAYFFKAYYVAIVMVMFAGVIAAVTLFFIAQKGWEHTNDHIETVFIVMTAVVAFYALFPPVFQQEKNISDNKELFLHYKSLESEVQSYPVTHTTLRNELKTPKEFINHIDFEMDRIGNIALGFDISKIDYNGAIELNKKASTPENTARPTPAPTKAPVRRRR